MPDSESLSSLNTLDSNVEPYEGPVQYDPRRDSAFGLERDGQRFVNGEENGLLENECLELADQRHHEELFGHQMIKDSLKRTEEDDIEQFPVVSRRNTVASRRDSLGRRTTTSSFNNTAPTRRDTVVSGIQNVTKKLGFWDERAHAERIKIYLTFAENYAYLVVGLTIALSLYWGSYYHRLDRYKDLKTAVIIADTPHGDLPAIVGSVVQLFFTNVTQIQALGDFDLWDYERISASAAKHNSSITAEVNRLVHHHKYWTAYYVMPNSTLNWYTALAAAANATSAVSTDFSPATSMLLAVLETARDYNAVNNYVSSVTNRLVAAFVSYAPHTPMVYLLLQSFSSQERANIVKYAPQLVTTPATFSIHDLIPIPQQIVQAPFQLGIVYMVVFTFFQFIFTIEIQKYIASKVKGWRFLALKMLASQFAYIVMSLSFVLLNRAFGMKTGETFGRLGFLVIWSVGYLLMSSLGSLIEILVILVMPIKAQLMGFVLVFVIILNLAPTIAPPVLCPKFYRYGYAMPVRNAYELFLVAYFDSWKGRMGLNIGILVAWIVVSNGMMPFVMMRIAKKEKAAAAAAAEASAEPSEEGAEKPENGNEHNEKDRDSSEKN